MWIRWYKVGKHSLEGKLYLRRLLRLRSQIYSITKESMPYHVGEPGMRFTIIFWNRRKADLLTEWFFLQGSPILERKKYGDKFRTFYLRCKHILHSKNTFKKNECLLDMYRRLGNQSKCNYQSIQQYGCNFWDS
jgi:hypothetical protein